MPRHPSLNAPVCAACGDRIGIYEPIWLCSADGEWSAASFLNVERGLRAGATGAELLHPGCGRLRASAKAA